MVTNATNINSLHMFREKNQPGSHFCFRRVHRLLYVHGLCNNHPYVTLYLPALFKVISRLNCADDDDDGDDYGDKMVVSMTLHV